MRRCNQCWREKPSLAFWSTHRGRYLQDCDTCRANRREPVKNHRRGLPVFSELRAKIVAESKNRKLGPIPEVYVTSSTCPPSCGLMNNGCYGEGGLLLHHWRAIEDNGVTWSELCNFVRELPPGQLWRYAVLGDLPGHGESIDLVALQELQLASVGKRGFAFTHKHADWLNSEPGFVVNLSAENLEQADRLYDWGPVAVVLPVDAPRRLNTPAGHLVIQCPATYQDLKTCSNCGLCAKFERKAIIGFPAHGLRKREVSERASR